MIRRAANGNHSLMRPGMLTMAASGFWSVNWPSITPVTISQNAQRPTRPTRNRVQGSKRSLIPAKRPNTRFFQNW